ncbi:hypothetical protein C1637_17270 [Chryseobacterium lactis]|uniref:DUF962 domain-containing protein n=1 Tax=Chryseobacterium lactis TaxID=1241981 RepID=A0A3G6RHP5_CHRLC|nr:Mpo1-like protein [Chryseobacterium lactis]AZA83010.1 DUF962 domain-containing protein [Chryseobacterium lactis]AZB03393.1 DUF962 domain-containing protein [Chryseobacterium lactis]PNW12321.1 hypothetical protein C1637_17270 [Chryseobacterium lactis]
MRKVDLLFAEYSKSHRNAINKFIHWICVPLIFWTILGFVSLIPAPHICISYFGCISIVSLIIISLITLFYVRLSLLIGVVMIVIMILMEHSIYISNINLGNQSWILYLSVFIITWIFQLIGHKIEGKKPTFLKDLQFLLVGPIWLLTYILKKVGIKY